MFKFERFPARSATYAAWLYYKRLPSIVTNVVESFGMIKAVDNNNFLHEVTRRARAAEERLRALEQWVDSPASRDHPSDVAAVKEQAQSQSKHHTGKGKKSQQQGTLSSNG